MKAVVLELRDKRAAVLSHDGIVRILPNQAYEVGQVLELSPEELESLEALFDEAITYGQNQSKTTG